MLDNAIKYTPSGGLVTVKSTTASGRVLVEVTDTGAGIPAEHVQDVFERFYRLDESRSRGIGGTGLGLALCRSIAEAHRGRIWIESEPGRGTKVSLELLCWTGGSDERSLDETNISTPPTRFLDLWRLTGIRPSHACSDLPRTISRSERDSECAPRNRSWARANNPIGTIGHAIQKIICNHGGAGSATRTSNPTGCD